MRTQVVEVEYENWRGETRIRRILPHPETLRFGTNQWHERPQWLFQATCLEDQTVKEFAMSGIKDWEASADQSLPWRTGEPKPRPSVPTHPVGLQAASAGFVGTAVKPTPMDFPNFGSGDTHNVEIIRGGIYYVTAEQQRKYDKEFRRLGITTIPIEEKPK